LILSSDIAIRVEGLGKEYIIGHQKSGDLRSSFAEKISGALGRNKIKESFWALKDLDFEIKKGEAVGIIGRNGAGKSTLLKILSRITEPTTGRFEINGRVSSLLEVGTGFHMELTGRENIFLNGTILGMKRAEIKQKFDEIVDFSGVEKFLDTPVKHYSSGMKVRLAFSVAAHLEPEILIVDEVLAVGDAEFQKKCLGKMDEVSKNEGRTVIFVSHNMGAVERLCDTGIHLERGKGIYRGEIDSALNSYLNNGKLNEGEYFDHNSEKETPFIKKVKVNTSLPDKIHQFGEVLEILFSINIPFELNDPALSFQIIDQLGVPIVHQWYFDKDLGNFCTNGEQKIICIIEKPRLYMGNYSLNVFFSEKKYDTNIRLLNICPFRIEMTKAREEFPWNEGACKYIEDSKWILDA
jgi:lipopolysaccharide transport system ATP-binding protein